MKQKILIVDDEKNTREGLKWALENEEREISLAADGKEAYQAIDKNDFDLIITDLKMPDLDGMELLRLAKKENPETEVIIITGFGTIESAVQAMKIGAYDYITKPINIDELNLLVDRSLKHKAMKEENISLKEQLREKHAFNNIIGRSPAMLKIFQQIRLVAPTKATVLVQGESGTGKELIASAIHYNSPRRDKPLITVNCGALSPTLLESELFGHEKGAFTDAHRRKLGRFELADEGTIFLDEITETSKEFQVKLLRVLQEQEFDRVGGTETIKVDVRVITATNKDLEKCVKNGKFREDLYYRLNVIQINVPPLRERPEDIPLLVEAFIKEFSQENNKEPIEIAPKAMTLLQNYAWPGNIRQLRNVIEGLVVMSTSRIIQPQHLPDEIREDAGEGKQLKIAVGSTMRDMEKEMIKATLLAVNGNKTKAAKLLGLGRKTLYRKLEEYGLS